MNIEAVSADLDADSIHTRLVYDPKAAERARQLERSLSRLTTPTTVPGVLEEAFVNLEFTENKRDEPCTPSGTQSAPLLMKRCSIRRHSGGASPLQCFVQPASWNVGSTSSGTIANYII
jgi:hypothetical protein